MFNNDTSMKYSNRIIMGAVDDFMFPINTTGSFTG